uniref:Fish-egg lectin-like n=1 Tax=Cyprinus carpio carpio TaxID=630221 RepID=A0A9J8BZV4_CYPCA
MCFQLLLENCQGFSIPDGVGRSFHQPRMVNENVLESEFVPLWMGCRSVRVSGGRRELSIAIVQPRKDSRQVDAGGDQINIGVTLLDDVFCLNKDANNIGAYSNFPWTQLPGKLKYYSCGPYRCWGVNAAGNIIIRRSVTGASCGGSGVFEAIAGALFMVEVDADGNVFGVDTQGNLVQR